MRIAAVLLLAVVATAQTLTDYDGWLGYDTKLEVAKTAGVSYLKFTVPASAIPPAPVNGSTAQHAWIRFQVDAAATTANGANVKFFITSTKPTGVPAVPFTFEKAASAPGFSNFDYKITAAGDYYLSVNSVACSTCGSTVEVKVGLWVRWTENPTLPPEATDPVAPYKFKDNSYTADYKLAVNTYGAAGWYTFDADTMVYIKVDLFTTSQGGAVTMVYKKDGAPSGDPKDQADIPNMWYKYPGAPITGDYSTGAKMLQAGTWYIAPWLSTAPSLGGNAEFDFAVGIGHEPSAAGAVMPSLAVLIATVAAFLAVSL